MKNRRLIKVIIAFIFLVLTPSVLQAQKLVKDKNRVNQLQREVWWSEWDGHTPSWFYWLIELFQSDEYRDEDRRNLLQLLPTLWMTKISKEQTEKEKEYVDAVAKDKLFILADMELDYAYLMVKPELNELRSRVTNNLSKAQKIGVYAAMIKEISKENTRIESRIYALRKSDLTNADRQLGYQSEAEAFRKLIVVSSRIIIAFEAVKR
jgi:hypothetical protein